MQTSSHDGGSSPIPVNRDSHQRKVTHVQGRDTLYRTVIHAKWRRALINDTLRADKSEVFLYEPTNDTLISSGISDTGMARKQIALGLDRLPLSNDGKTVHVFQTGESYHSGHLDEEPNELPRIKGPLGVRSVIVVPLTVDGIRRGYIQVDSAQPDRFPPEDIVFLEAVTRWIAMVLSRAELVERLTQEAAARARQMAADELMMTLAHDLRAPLTALKGRALMVQMRAQREGHQANLTDSDGITVAANRLERMIADLMDTARLEQGLFTLTPTALNLAAVARETATTLTTSDGQIEVRAPDEVAVEGRTIPALHCARNIGTPPRRDLHS